MTTTSLTLKNISIEFPGVKALQSVNFRAQGGKVHALIGANGAGKSTLMKVLSGNYSNFSGDILMNGEKISIASPRDAQKQGIQIVPQEVDTALIPYLSVGENIMIHTTTVQRGMWMNWKSVHNKANELLNRLNINISSTKLVQDLTLAEKQMILIARALTVDCKFLILDEPTAPLSTTETNKLFEVVRKLQKDRVGIIFISHRLPEIFSLCDEITILRNGELVEQEQIIKTTPNKVVEKMLGKKLEEQFPKRINVIGNNLLQVINLSDRNKLANINMTVNKGEIVGIAGLVGAGKSELCKALFGSEPLTSGIIKLHNKEITLSNPVKAVQLGIALIPEERRKEGILISESVTSNLSVASLQNHTNFFHFISRLSEQEKAKELIKSLGIKTPSTNTVVQYLSGGNQQKIAIGKWLSHDAQIYIFDEPTKGVDVGAKRDIFDLIHNLALQGKGIIYASSETAEIIGLTDRAYVMYDGQIVKELNSSQTNEEEILFYAAGGSNHAN